MIIHIIIHYYDIINVILMVILSIEVVLHDVMLIILHD
jgi:hypothetical protein